MRVLFTRALDAEGLLSDELLAISDNGSEMKCRDTRKFTAVWSIAQHFGRPSTPTDQAWIETLWGHVRYEHPHLLAVGDPAVLAAELERVRVHYNTVRLHEAIGYVTPDDEHTGRADAIRAARRSGLERADRKRRLWNRAHRSPAMTTNLTATTCSASTTNNQPPAVSRCGLNETGICCKESETPHQRQPPHRDEPLTVTPKCENKTTPNVKTSKWAGTDLNRRRRTPADLQPKKCDL